MEWLTIRRLGELSDALGVDPASLWNALDSSAQQVGWREAECVGE